MNHRSSRALCATTVAALLLAACGGRYQTLREVQEETGGGGAQSIGHGGAAAHSGSPPSKGGSPGSGASSSAGSPSAGSPGSSGSPSSGSAGASGGINCANVDCAAPNCLNGTMPLILPGQCCATSCSACPACPMFKCPAGSHLEKPAGECCPICLLDAGPLCEKGRQAYAVDREAILNKYRFGCASDSECVTIAPYNLCEQGCGYAAVWYGVADSLESSLADASNMYCSSCMKMPIPPCLPPGMARCVNSQCRF